MKSAVSPLACKPLQWGRVVKDAEISVSGLLARKIQKLQWGRVVKDAEILLSSHATASLSCFNGAAS